MLCLPFFAIDEHKRNIVLQPEASICLEYWGDTICGVGMIGRAATAHGRRPCWGWVRDGVAPSRNGGPGVSPPEKFEFHIAADEFWGIFMGQKSYETSEGSSFHLSIFHNLNQFV